MAWIMTFGDFQRSTVRYVPGIWRSYDKQKKMNPTVLKVELQCNRLENNNYAEFCTYNLTVFYVVSGQFQHLLIDKSG